VSAVAGGRLPIPPLVRTGERTEHFIAAAGDERQDTDPRRRVTGGGDETRVVVLRHRKTADVKLLQVDAMRRPLVGFGVGGAHEELTCRNPRERRRCGKRQGRR
jgi:hypothetical protein